MRILISNDDGYFSPGIAALAEVAREFGEVTVVAPERDRSGASNSLTLDRPLTVRAASSGFLYVNGTPTDCVHIAITGLIGERPDLVISGINDGANMGDDTIYSGTVAAATEGYQLGIPAIAFSLAVKGYEHLDTAAHAAREVLARYVRNPATEPMLLNVNVPGVSRDRLQGLRTTRLGKRHVGESVVRSRSPRGDTIYWIGPAGEALDSSPGTDFGAVAPGWVSITPLDVDLTAHQRLPAVQNWLDRTI
jgi:5'-nucleotidase